MLRIVNITSKFHAPAVTIARKLTNPNVIGSTWTVSFVDGSTRTKRIYYITLSEDSPSPHYDSKKNIEENNKYFIQIADKIFTTEAGEGIITCPVAPRYEKGKPLLYYQISPDNFETISITKVLDKFDVTDEMIVMIGKLELTAQQAKRIFQDFFEELLLSKIGEEDPSIEDGRIKETDHLLSYGDSETLCCGFSNICEFFKKIFCCS